MKILQQSKLLSPEKIIQKIEYYCSYRDRCEVEVLNKLTELGVEKTDTELYLNHLKAQNFLNEERFVNAFVRGKFGIKNWGKKKIFLELKQKNISEKEINKALLQIENTNYLEKLELLLTKKNKLLKETDSFKRKQKLIQYALQKGYEIEHILIVLEK